MRFVELLSELDAVVAHAAVTARRQERQPRTSLVIVHDYEETVLQHALDVGAQAVGDGAGVGVGLDGQLGPPDHALGLAEHAAGQADDDGQNGRGHQQLRQRQPRPAAGAPGRMKLLYVLHADYRVKILIFTQKLQCDMKQIGITSRYVTVKEAAKLAISALLFNCVRQSVVNPAVIRAKRRISLDICNLIFNTITYQFFDVG